MLFRNKNTLIEGVALVCFALVFLSICVGRHSDNLPAVISSDARGYYMYLPSLFVYKDVHHLPDEFFQGRQKNSKGEYFTKYSCGTAYCFLPFFLAAHLYAHMANIDASGFSAPYCYAVMVCGVFWGFLGLFFLKRLLSAYFSRSTTRIVILLIMLGTNFFNYASFETGMSHVYSFALFSATMLVVDNYYRRPRMALAMLAGALMAWTVLIRPTNASIVFFLILWNVVTKEDLRYRFAFLKNYVRHIPFALVCFLVVLLPQLLYWKAMTGQWIKYSYSGEGFDNWAHPRVADVLFSTQNGLFIYTPLFLFSFWALFARRKDPRTNFWGISIIFIVITYLFASWWVPCFCAGFGHRCYVEYQTLFAFPLAVTIENIAAIKKTV